MARYKIINNVEYDISLNISPFKNEKKKKKMLHFGTKETVRNQFE